MAMGVLFGPADNSSITFVGNLMAHIVERNPLSRAAELVSVNNVVYDRGTMDTDLQSEESRVTKSSVVGNVLPARAAATAATRRPIFVRTNGDHHAVSRQSRVCLRQPRAGHRQLVLAAGVAHRRRRDPEPDDPDHRSGVEFRDSLSARQRTTRCTTGC